MTYNFEELRQSIINEHNRLLSDPQSYIPILEKYITYFKNDILYVPSQPGVQTKEGPKAYLEAKAFLENVKPLDPMTHDERLFRAASDHVNDIGSRGIISHEGSDGSGVTERIERYCEWEGICVENIDFGSKTAVDVIVSFLVDDGLEGRPHRKNMFSNEAKFFGVAIGEHKETGVVTVIDYIGGIREKGKPFYDYKNFKYQYPENLNAKPVKKKIKNTFQYEDDDAPDATVSVKITKQEKEFDGKKHWVTRKIYSLSDGTQQIVEIEDF
jgi:uncharacterized protein YkwD